MTQHDWDVIIAGGGPAGLSAALMLGRARRRVLVVDAGAPRNRASAHVHAVLGFDGVPPSELIARGRAEAARYGVEFVTGSVERVEREPDGLRVVAGDGERSARALVIATGMRDELPELPGLAPRWGTSVLHCPYCHGWEVRDRRLGVLTTSPLGLHQAELVRQWSDRVTVFTAGLGDLDPDVARRFRARGVVLEPSPVVELLGEGTGLAAARLADGRDVPLDAIFTAGTPRPLDDLVAGLDLARDEQPLGSVLAVDAAGATSDERIWAVGNVVHPNATVPMSMGGGALAGGAVNGALVTWDTDAAASAGDSSGSVDPHGHRAPRGEAHGEAGQAPAPADFWEARYAGSDRVWSGRVNAVLADVAQGLAPGRALDLGCGEGADVIWLAQHGWDATGIDISPTAIRRATEAAAAAGVADRAQFLAADLAAIPPGPVELVTASFLHSPVELAREDILRRAAAHVTPGGHLLITSHAAPPPWSDAHGHDHRFLTPAEELAQLELAPDEWEVRVLESRERTTTGPDGRPAVLDDVVVLARRLA